MLLLSLMRVHETRCVTELSLSYLSVSERRRKDACRVSRVFKRQERRYDSSVRVFDTSRHAEWTAWWCHGPPLRTERSASERQVR